MSVPAQNETLQDLFAGFKGKKDELIPVMEAVQEKFGYLSPQAMKKIAGFLKVSESHIYGVATFYALFRLSPRGKKMVSVCRGTACHVRGGAHILQEVEKHLGIKPGETTADREYSLETISCFGSCALAPVMVVDKTVYGRMTPARVGQILGKSEKD
ncbi:MAG: NADH-quinone oxidoreductase subunit NuoE [Dehalococcoidales bacterium]|nr:NADH-quinone oxidoreductase subunit NuoE [Dehalococcoidales bacterium]